MKHFVLDTNVLLHDPRAILQFADNEVVIPIFVLEEVDTFKKEASERGRNAREVARMLDTLRANGRLSDGIPLPEGGGRVRVASAARSVPTTLRESQIADHLILMVALDVRDLSKDGPDDLRHEGREPAHPGRRARVDVDGLRGRADRHRRALLGHDGDAGSRRPTWTPSTRRARWR